MKNKTYKIGIGITTHNRYDVFRETLNKIIKFSHNGMKIVVVDDASKKPVKEATYRFDKNVGIATAKNKCLELLDDCEHIFLFDDDTYPIKENWYIPYIESVEPHLMYIFKDFKKRSLNDSEIIYNDGKIKAYTHPRGCMLYIRNDVLKVAGGMDIGYKRWGYEHVDYSNRIYNLGLTSFRFADVVGSENLIYSGDEHEAVETTVEHSERMVYIREMKGKYNDSFKSTQFKPYKNYEKVKKTGRSVIITTFLNAVVDNQRGKVWEADYTKLYDLIKSTNKHNLELVILNNCFNKKDSKLVKHVSITQAINPYLQRWLSIWQYLRDNPGIDYIFAVDGTDVEVLQDPFTDLEEDIIYMGDETEKLGCRWMMNIAKKREMQEYFVENRAKTLLNCGVIGGSRNMMMKLLKDCLDYYFYNARDEVIDMTVFNYIIYNKYHDKVEHGRKITTIFKAYENQSQAWFKHK